MNVFILHRFDELVQLHQLNVAFHKIGEEIEVDIDNIRRSHSRLQGDQKLIVHFRVRIIVHR